jgi:hypothetical protein
MINEFVDSGRLLQLGFIQNEAADEAKIHLKSLMSDIGIG